MVPSWPWWSGMYQKRSARQIAFTRDESNAGHARCTVPCGRRQRRATMESAGLRCHAWRCQHCGAHWPYQSLNGYEGTRMLTHTSSALCRGSQSKLAQRVQSLCSSMCSHHVSCVLFLTLGHTVRQVPVSLSCYLCLPVSKFIRLFLSKLADRAMPACAAKTCFLRQATFSR